MDEPNDGAVAMGGRSGRRSGRAAAAVGILLLLLAVAATYRSVLDAGFVYDDAAYVEDNPGVAGGLTPAGIRWAFTAIHEANWHPLTWISHQADVSLFGLDPAGHHAASVVIHAANALLLLAILRSLTGAFAPSLLAAALFALHPLRVESVAWISERKDVLSGFFLMLTLLAYGAWVRRARWWRYGVLLVAYVAGLMSKPMLVTLPALLLVLDFWPLGRGGSAAVWLRRIAEKVPLLVPAAVSAAVTIHAQSAGGALQQGGHPLGVRMANAAISTCRYLLKTVWPADLSVFYRYPDERGIWLPAAACVVALAGMTTVAVRQARVRPWLAAGWCWYLVALIPVIGLVQVGEQGMADRYTYIPLIGIFVAAAWGWREVGSRLRLAWTARIGIPAAIVAALGIGAAAQVGHWRDERSLFSHALAVDPGNPVAHERLGAVERREGNLREAERHLRAALESAPYSVPFNDSLAGILIEKGALEEAERRSRMVLRGMPGDLTARVNLAVALQEMGRSGEAAAELERVLRVRPDHPLALVNLGNILSDLGRDAEAVERYRRALAVRPGYAVGHFNLALSYARLGLPREAAAECREALRLDPAMTAARDLLSRLPAR